jgi:hypothetical protein
LAEQPKVTKGQINNFKTGNKLGANGNKSQLEKENKSNLAESLAGDSA